MIYRLLGFILSIVALCTSSAYAQKVQGYPWQNLAEHARGVTAIAFSPNAKFLISGSWDKTLKLWAMPKGEIKKTLVGHSEVISSVAFSPNSKIIASGSADKTIKLWGPHNGQQLFTLKGHSGEVTSVAFSKDGSVLASGGADRSIKLWSLARGKPLVNLIGHTDRVVAVAFSKDGKLFLSAGADGTVRIGDLIKGREKYIIETPNAMAIHTLSLSKNGETLACGGEDGSVIIWSIKDIKKNKKNATAKLLSTIKNHRKAVQALEISPDGKYLASSGGDQIVVIWSIREQEVYARLLEHEGVITDLAYSPDKRILGTASLDTTIKLML